MKILIVEDQPMDILGTHELLRNLGHHVTLTFDGAKCLDEIFSNRFDFIILDWNLPFVSGEECLKRLDVSYLNTGNHWPVKIIIHSAEDLEAKDFRQYANLQILDIWKKPMWASDISKRLKQFTENYKRAA